MEIKIANSKEKEQALKIAKLLPEWFDDIGIKSLETDFKMNHVIVAIENKDVLGFLCYSSYGGRMLLMWLGVKKSLQRRGIGKELLSWLEKEAKRLGLYYIELETLPEEEDYKPYELTRNFYYKYGFKKVHYEKASIKGWDDQIILEKNLNSPSRL